MEGKNEVPVNIELKEEKIEKEVVKREEVLENKKEVQVNIELKEENEEKKEKEEVVEDKKEVPVNIELKEEKIVLIFLRSRLLLLIYDIDRIAFHEGINFVLFIQ